MRSHGRLRMSGEPWKAAANKRMSRGSDLNLVQITL